MPWVNSNGEITGDTCPSCEGYSLLEREARNYRAKITRLENEAERNLIAARDGATWKAILAYWQAAFPDKKISSKGIKSARATKFFQRLEAGATSADVEYAIDAAAQVPYVVYGRRVKTGSRADLAVDLEDICSVGHDARFDELVELGRELAQDAAW